MSTDRRITADRRAPEPELPEEFDPAYAEYQRQQYEEHKNDVSTARPDYDSRYEEGPEPQDRRGRDARRDGVDRRISTEPLAPNAEYLRSIGAERRAL